jgi:predicted XRE-type DNA-binding protein
MRNTKGANKPSHVTKSSVFDDLGLSREEAIEAKIKADLWRDLVNHIDPLGLSQKDLARKLSVHQPDVSNLLTGKLSKFSVDALIGYAVRLGLGVRTRITMPKPQQGTVKQIDAAQRLKRSSRKVPAGAV